MRLEWFLALRYFRRAEGQREGRAFVRFITYVAVGGVTVGVAALILALGIVRGFSQEIEGKLMDTGAHLSVVSYMDAPLEDAETIRAQIRAQEAVREVRAVIEEVVIARTGPRSIEGLVLIGTDALPELVRTTAHQASADEQPGDDPSGFLSGDGILVSRSIASRFEIAPEDRLTLFALERNSTSAAHLQPRVQQYPVAATYATSLDFIDDTFLFLPLEEARRFLEYPDNQVSRFEVMLHRAEDIEPTARALSEELSFPAAVRTVYQQYAGLFAWINLQQNIVPLVISIIVIVAAFNIVGTLLMMMLEKTREIGVLMSMGLSARGVQRVFLVLGAVIGFVGSALGTTIAVGTGWIQQTYGVIPLPAEAYYMDTAPMALSMTDVLLVTGVAFVLCLVAAYIPARVASRIDPVRVIRFT
ncbi:MAG: ABC transporter permease [Longimonas sp.]|uniref:ABC transporter permease n=1 Tax=Longimonas sp. TaxID=2039626 RepID=UPI0033456819